MAELRYKAWGETRCTYGITPTAYKFTGQRLDESTGLYYYGARYYDPALGRFLQPDTLVPEPGNPQALNRYAYTLNNPLKYTDPSGYFTEEQIEQYLKEKYKEKWRDYLRAWRYDKVFWEMLLLADYGDVLYAPTSSLTSGTFVRAGSTFDFASEYGLHEYQGYGPYSLTNAQGSYKLHFSTAISAHPADTDSLRYQIWEQPLYRYTENGPVYSGYNRRVAYQYRGLDFRPFAGSGLPWVVFTFIPQAAKGIGVICPPCGPIVTGVSALGYINNATVLHYGAQVSGPLAK